MRIDRLDLKAYGPFSGRSLDLSGPGVHLVIGPNEAGKSTTLTAIGDALFGFPHQNAARFVHEKLGLELGMTLRRSDGSTLSFDRLKKRVGSLRRVDGSVISDEEFRQFLGAIDRDVFSNMYGIDHARLVAGGEDLLAGKGELGAAILGAGVGAVNLPQALKQLADRADGLFTPRAQKPKLNSAISRYDELVKVANGHSLRPAEFAETVAEIERLSNEKSKATDRKEAITSERDECRTLVNLFDRIGQRRIAMDQHSELEPITRRLPEGLGGQLDALTTQLDSLRAAERKSAGRLTDLESQIESLLLDPAVLERKSDIRELGDARAKYRSEVENLPGMRQACEALSRAVRNGLIRLGIVASDSDLESARPALTVSVTLEARVTECADRESEIRAAGKSVSELVGDTRADLNRAREKLEELTEVPDLRLLSASVRSLQTQEDLSARRETVAAGLRSAEAELAAATSRLGLGSVTPAVLLSLRVPTRAALNDLRQTNDELVSEGRKLRDQAEDVDAARSKLNQQLDELLSGGDIPSVDDLRSARSGRDATWSRVRASWLGTGGGVPGPGTEPRSEGPDAEVEGVKPSVLADEYEAAVTGSDRLVDRLRDEAEVVATRAALEAQIAELDCRADLAASALESHASQLAEFERAWVSTWAPLEILPGSPASMSEWLDDYTKAAHTAGSALKLQSDLDDVTKRVESQRVELFEALRSVGIEALSDTTLATLTQRAVSALDSLTSQNQARVEALTTVTQLEEQLKSHVSKSARHEAELSRWEQDWLKVSSDLGLSHLSPAEAKSHLVEASKVLADLDRIAEINTQISALAGSIAAYEARIGEIASELGESGEAGDPLAVLGGLTSRLTEADTCMIKHDALLESRSEIADQLQGERADLFSAEDRLNGLLGDAAVESESELRDAIERSDRLRAVETTISRLTEELSSQSGGRTADELDQILADRDRSKLQLVADERNAELDEIDAELADLNSQLGARKSDLNRWDGSSKAADATNESQLVLSEIGSLTEEYLAAQMAVELLRDHISSFREKNQGPILKRAAPWFERMTGGSFQRLEANYESGESVVLEAIRPNGQALTVEQMSEGTRDQLYLALRLAALAESATAGEPYPIVLDDLLMTFDDARAEATLEVLGELSEHTQILLFTHHQHLRQVAEAALGSRLTCHEL